MNKSMIISRVKIAEFCERHHIQQLGVFGSALRDDFRPDSDVDVLVQFEANHVPGFFGLFDMEEELSGLLGGRKVDMRTPEDISRYFRDKVIANMEVQYVRR